MIKASRQKWKMGGPECSGYVRPLLGGGFDHGDIPGMKSNMQEIFLLGPLRTHAVHSEISTSIFYPNCLKSLSVILGSFYGVARILRNSLTKPGRSGFFSEALKFRV